jgi:hypothetical protein
MLWAIMVTVGAVTCSPPATGACFVVDTFDDGFFFMQGYDPGASADKDMQTGSGMIRGERSTSISSTASLDAIGAFATVRPGTSVLEFDCGFSMQGEQVEFRASYGLDKYPDYPPMDLTGSTGFEFIVPLLEGVGQVSVTIRNAFSGGGNLEFTAPLDESGLLFVPIDPEALDPMIATNVHMVWFTLSGASSDFSVSVAEFRVVPEPGIGAIVGLVISLGGIARKRS